MICQKCDNEFSYFEGMKFCPHCGEPIQQPDAAPETAPVDPRMEQPVADGKIKVPWEDRTFSYLEGFWITFRESVFNAGDFFKRINAKGEIFMPLLYGIVWVIILQLVNYLYMQMFGNPLLDVLRKIFEQQGIPMDDQMSSSWFARITVAQLMMLPFLYAIGIFIWSGILHLFLLMFGAAKNGFSATFRTISYVQGAGVFNIIPVIGGLIAFVWQMVIGVIAFKEMHETTHGRVVMAVVVLPLALCVFCCVFVAMVIGFAGAAALGIQ